MSMIGRPPVPVEVRFWAFVQKTESCWNWTGRRHPRGYPIAHVGGGFEATAARVSWEMHNGWIPNGMRVFPSCGNRLCVRPDHLALGKSTNGGRRFKNGEKNPNAKLTCDDVIKIKVMLSEKLSFAEIGRKMNVSWQTIREIAHGRTWKSVHV